MRKKLTPPLKTHGGKSYLADKIIALMPPRCKNPNKPDPKDTGWLHYVEPYFGGGAVLLAQNPEGISEVANDINGTLMNFWRILSNPNTFEKMYQCLLSVPFSQWEYIASSDLKNFRYQSVPVIDYAIKFLIHCRQSLSGRMKGFAGVTRNRTRRGMNEQVSAWANSIMGLPEVHARLMRVLIFNRPAIDVIKGEDGVRTLFYLDPPYIHESRVAKDTYSVNEMSNEQHRELLTLLNGIKGKFLLSGYHSDMYDQWAYERNFICHEFKIDNKASSGKKKRVMTECVWTNF